MASAKLFRLLTVLCLTLTAAYLPAQTEIMGEVTGEWTTEGSPYTVVDSTWIPEGGELIIQRGVEVFFNENQGLYIFGHIEVRGVQYEAPVRFTLAGIEHWRGLRFYGEREAVFESLIVDGCPDTLFYLDNRCALEFRNCYLDADEFVIMSYSRPSWTNRGWRLEFYNTFLRGGNRLSTVGSVVIAENSQFNLVGSPPGANPGFRGESNTYEFYNCEILGGISGVYNSIVEDCTISGQGQTWSAGVSIRGPEGRMMNTTVHGDVSLGGDFNHFLPFEDNIVTDGMTVMNLHADINRCDIGNLVRIGNSIANFRDCILPGHFTAWGSCVMVDSCQLVNEGFLDECISFDDGTRATITRSVLILDWASFSNDTEVNFDHNTVLFKRSRTYSMLVSGPNVNFMNSIFLVTENAGSLFMSDHSFVFGYNCVSGYNNYRLGRDQEMFELPPNNLEVDPLLEWYGNSPLLTADSPCIDAGDPDSPPDQDGTRSDLGAYAFNQPNFISHNDPGLNDLSSHNLVQAYPNPFNSSLNISYQINTANPVTITLFDLAGREVLSKTGLHQTGTGIININVPSLPTGRYNLIVRSDNFTKVVPILRFN